MTNLAEKNIIVTGAAGSIGQAIASQCIVAGAKLALFERTPALAKRAKQQLEAQTNLSPPLKIESFVADLSDAPAVKSAMDAAMGYLGHLDGLVNNAAMLDENDSDPEHTSLPVWQKTLAVNLTGAFLMCQHSLPHLQNNGGGSIVALSSVVARAASAIPQIAYTTAKGGLEAMTREIAIAYARKNIRANCVAPGPILTPRTQHYFDTDEKWQKRRAHIPMGRLGRADEIAPLILFLLGPDSTYMTGGVYLADGGISAAYVVNDENGTTRP